MCREGWIRGFDLVGSGGGQARDRGFKTGATIYVVQDTVLVQRKMGCRGCCWHWGLVGLGLEVGDCVDE